MNIFPDRLISNYAAAVLNVSEDQISRVIQDLNNINGLVNKLRSNYNEGIFHSQNGQRNIVKLIKLLNLTQVAKNLFIKLLVKHKIDLIPLICQRLLLLVKKKSGIHTAEVFSVSRLTDEEMSQISSKLSDISSKNFEIKNISDPSILGGIKVKFESYLLDNSLINKIQRVQKHLSENKLEF